MTCEQLMQQTEIVHNDISDFFSSFGGAFSLIWNICIMFPIVYYVPKWFLTFIVDYIYKQERANKVNWLQNKSEGQAKEAIKKRYLKRVSMLGIYDLYETIDQQSKEIKDL